MKLFILLFALSYAEITEVDCGTEADTIKCKYDDQTLTLTIDGDGELSVSKPWMTYKSAEKVVITGNIQTIPSDIFSCTNWNGFKNLKSVSFGAQISEVTSYVFFGCQSIEEVLVEEGNQNLISDEGVLYKVVEDKLELVIYPRNRAATEYTIPDKVVVLPYQSFHSVRLESIDCGNDMEIIKKEAFYQCSQLKYVKFGSQVSTIEPKAFLSCNAIESFEVDECNRMFTAVDGVLMTKSIGNEALLKYPPAKQIESIYTIPSNIKVIYDNAFSGRVDLEEVIISGNVYSIHSNAFTDCTALKKVTLRGNINSIGTEVFKGCSELSEVIIGEEVKMIGDYMFAYCKKLTTITLEGTSQLRSIESYAFQETGIKEFVIPDSVMYLMDNAFENSKLESIVIGKLVTGIAFQTFHSCKNLHSVVFNTQNLLTIDQYAFELCEKLTKITIPSTVQIISIGAFTGCTELTDVTISGSKQPAYCSISAFDDVEKINLIVPTGYEELEFCGIPIPQQI